MCRLIAIHSKILFKNLIQSFYLGLSLIRIRTTDKMDKQLFLASIFLFMAGLFLFLHIWYFVTVNTGYIFFAITSSAMI